MIKALSTALAIALFAAPVAAGCGDRKQMLEVIEKQVKESAIVVGVTDQGLYMELFFNEGTGTWRLAVTRPDGIMCIAQSGVGAERVAPEPAGIDG